MRIWPANEVPGSYRRFPEVTGSWLLTVTYGKWRARLANANNPVFVPITYIDELLADGLAQFWATADAAIVTHAVEWPGGAVTLKVIAAAGKKADITGELKDAAEGFARSIGCTHTMVEGRDGWRHALTDYEHYQTVLVREL